jgi:hypothetical protein
MLNTGLVRALLIFIFVSGSVTINHVAAAQEDPCQPHALDMGMETDTRTENCFKAFCALPAAERRGDIVSSDFAKHVLANRDLYEQYDRACFNKWNELKHYSQDFLNDVFGALFWKSSNGLILTCSAFRIAEDIIVTARHCIYGSSWLQPSPNQFLFRLIGAPDIDIPVIGELQNHFPIPKNQVANDFGDYWYLKIAKVGLDFRKQQDDFRSTVRQGTWLLFSGISRPALLLDAEGDDRRWASSFRWTKVAGAQWIPELRLPKPPPSVEAAKACIYHKAPSFNGMSGAPIIGSDPAPSADKPPKLFVTGLHLRSGAPDLAHQDDADCGDYPAYNIGLALPADVLRRVIPRPPLELPK